MMIFKAGFKEQGVGADWLREGKQKQNIKIDLRE